MGEIRKRLRRTVQCVPSVQVGITATKTFNVKLIAGLGCTV
jgi:hypothetical protein